MTFVLLSNHPLAAVIVTLFHEPPVWCALAIDRHPPNRGCASICAHTLIHEPEGPSIIADLRIRGLDKKPIA